MRVSLDGGQTYLQAPEGVRVAVEGDFQDGFNSLLELIVTHEGLIIDHWCINGRGEVSENLATESSTFYDIVHRLK